MNIFAKKYWTILGLVGFVLCGRLLPHLNNFSPLIALSLLAPALLRRRFALIGIFAGMLLSDAALMWLDHYAFVGSWTLFVYSGLLAVILFGAVAKRFLTKFSSGLLVVIFANLGFWTWTNFGVWLMDGIYAHSISGLATCFAAGLPFLQHSTLSAAVWFALIRLTPHALRFTRHSKHNLVADPTHQ